MEALSRRYATGGMSTPDATDSSSMGCPECGYEVGVASATVCPECGAEIGEDARNMWRARLRIVKGSIKLAGQEMM